MGCMRLPSFVPNYPRYICAYPYSYVYANKRKNSLL